MSEHFSSITCALVISLIILFFILLIYVIKAIREHSDAKTYYSYVPKFPNEIVEKYYYQIYEIIVTDFHVLHDRKKCKVYKYLIFICLILFGLFLILGGEIDFPPLLFLSFASLISSFVFAFLVYTLKIPVVVVTLLRFALADIGIILPLWAWLCFSLVSSETYFPLLQVLPLLCNAVCSPWVIGTKFHISLFCGFPSLWWITIFEGNLIW